MISTSYFSFSSEQHEATERIEIKKRHKKAKQYILKDYIKRTCNVKQPPVTINNNKIAMTLLSTNFADLTKRIKSRTKYKIQSY